MPLYPQFKSSQVCTCLKLNLGSSCHAPIILARQGLSSILTARARVVHAYNCSWNRVVCAFIISVRFGFPMSV
jgi:hypothetical protein